MTELPKSLIDINKASLKELTTIRGVGPSLAQAIIDHRPYKTIQDLVQVPGIKENKLGSIAPFMTVGKKEAKIQASIEAPMKPSGQISELGTTETFVFLENHKDRQDALLIILGGFIFGMVLLFLRRSNR